MLDCTLTIVGSAGEGIQTIGDILGECLAGQGYPIFAWKEYESRIRGGHNSYSIRVQEVPCHAPTDDTDILIALNPQSLAKYRKQLKRNGVVICEEDMGPGSIEVPFRMLAEERVGGSIYANSIAAGAAAGVLGLREEALEEVLVRRFKGKIPDVIEANRKAARIGYLTAQRECRDLCPWHFPPQGNSFYLVSGNEALPMGAIRAGCRFIAAYPMTPSTGVITFLAHRSEERKIFCEQAEDEIAAINMALGASYAGVRAMTTTSGGGFALMVEAISLSGMAEIPVVIVLAQRPGPATGLPTRTAQGDLLFAIRSGHGEFPKAVLAPADAKDAFHKMVRAFDLAEQFQIPVIVMTDQFLADSRFSIEDFQLEACQPRRYTSDPDLFSSYRRYQVTSNGISPRLHPGRSTHVVAADSDEHDEWGHITEDLAETVPSMVRKRLRKAETLRENMAGPETYRVEEAREIFCSWGSSRGVVREAVDQLRSQGEPVGMIHWTELWPPPPFSPPKPQRFWTVETNATAQLASLLREGYGLAIRHHILRYDGLPLTARFIGRKYHEEA